MVGLAKEQLQAEWPLAGNDVEPPRDFTWPQDLPHSQPLDRFYSMCDGGYFGNSAYHIFRGGELLERTRSWVELLRDYDERGDVLIAGRHLVFGEDAAGAPLVWDAETDEVATFWFKGGDWEHVSVSPSAFLQELFNPDPDKDPGWALAVAQIHRS